MTPERPRRPLVALVGRPNVGKSTLFNRLLRRRKAIVEDAPGVTRDRHYADGALGDREVTLVDTGGFVPDERGDPLTAQIRQQAQLAVEECQVVVLVVDGVAGLVPGDSEVARALRKSGRPVVVAVNKVDDPRRAELLSAEFHRLGLGEPLAVSAEHVHGVQALSDAVEALLPPAPEAIAAGEGDQEGEDASQRPIRVAIVGRPNVGKSTLVNALLGQERVIVSDVSGTTRDPIDTALTWQDQAFVLTDTAGIRRKATIAQRVEQFSVVQALRVIEDCDVAALVLDGTEPAVEQDARIAGIAEEKGRPLLLVVNKWDLAKGKAREDEVRDTLRHQLKWVDYAPVVFVSAKQGLRVAKVLELARALHRQAHYRAPTPQLNKVLKHVSEEHPAPWHRGRALRLYYAAQVATAPPAFQFLCNMPKAVPDPYRRYITNHLRQVFGLQVPIRLFFRERPGKAERSQTVGRYRARKAARRR